MAHAMVKNYVRFPCGYTFSEETSIKMSMFDDGYFNAKEDEKKFPQCPIHAKACKSPFIKR